SAGGAAWQTALWDRHHRPAATAAAPASPPVVGMAGAALRRALVAAPALPARHRATGAARSWVVCAGAGRTKPRMQARTRGLPPRLPGHGREEPWPHA